MQHFGPRRTMTQAVSLFKGSGSFARFRKLTLPSWKYSSPQAETLIEGSLIGVTGPILAETATRLRPSSLSRVTISFVGSGHVLVLVSLSLMTHLPRHDNHKHPWLLRGAELGIRTPCMQCATAVTVCELRCSHTPGVRSAQVPVHASVQNVVFH